MRPSQSRFVALLTAHNSGFLEVIDKRVEGYDALLLKVGIGLGIEPVRDSASS